jgi:hypothetical protein
VQGPNPTGDKPATGGVTEVLTVPSGQRGVILPSAFPVAIFSTHWLELLSQNNIHPAISKHKAQQPPPSVMPSKVIMASETGISKVTA